MFLPVSRYETLDGLAVDPDMEEKSLRIRGETNEYREDLRWLMGSRSGRRIVMRWLSEMRFMLPVNDTNGLAQSHKAGAQAVASKIASEMLEACPDQFTLMIKESHDREPSRNPRN